MALNLAHQTAVQFAARFWSRVKAAQDRGDKVELCRLVWWIWNRIQLGDLTSDQVRLSYNAAFTKTLNTAQWNSFVTSTLVPMKDKYLAIRDQVNL